MSIVYEFFVKKKPTENIPVTKDDIESLYKPNYDQNSQRKYNPQNTLIPKIEKYKTDLNYNIPESQYDNIYALSDIHADYRRFLKLLSDNKIIKLPDGFDGASLYTDTDEIYNPALITDVQWICAPKTLLVICGDIVDGSRDRDVNDPRGSFEILVLTFIVNLKFKAKKSNSDVMFLFGNHDAEIFYKYEGTEEQTPNNYVHKTAQKFFDYKFTYKTQKISVRSNALFPFYKKSPFLFIHIINDKKENIITFAHGGLIGLNHKKNVFADIRKETTEYQTQIINTVNTLNILTTSLTNITKIFKTMMMTNHSDMVTNWTRAHFKYPKSYCDETTSPTKMNINTTFIVGHCITSLLTKNNEEQMWLYNNRYEKLTNQDEEPAKTCKNSDSDENVISGEIGCIYPYCFKPNTDIPRMVLVDTGMSFAFNLEIDNNNTKLDKTGDDILEILLIEKSSGITTTTFDKYYYVRNGKKTLIENNEDTNKKGENQTSQQPASPQPEAHQPASPQPASHQPASHQPDASPRPESPPIEQHTIGGRSRRVKKQKKNSRKYTKKHSHSKTKKSRRKSKKKKSNENN